MQCSVKCSPDLSTVQCLCIARLVFGWLSDIGKFAGPVPLSEPEPDLSQRQRERDMMSLANKYQVHTEDWEGL